MIIYCAENLVSGKKYIGMSKNSLNRRIIVHKSRIKLGTKTKFYDAIRSYGFYNFNWFIIDTAETIVELKEKEQQWIKKLDTINVGYNMTKGGDGGDTMSNHPNKEEIYKKVSENCSKILKGKKKSLEHIKALRLACAGKKLSEQTKKKISNTMRKRPPMKGKHHSIETKKKIGEKSRLRSLKICLMCGIPFMGGHGAKCCSGKCVYYRRKAQAISIGVKNES